MVLGNVTMHRILSVKLNACLARYLKSRYLIHGHLRQATRTIAEGEVNVDTSGTVKATPKSVPISGTRGTR